VDTLSSQTGSEPDSDRAGLDSARVWLTVSQLNRAVARSLERNFGPMRVRGELASLTRAASGHWYFALKDRTAQVRCVMFRSRNVLVDFTPREGDDLELVGSVGLYESKGEFQLAVESMRRAGQGQLFEQFLRLKERLAAEGLFDQALKRPIPRIPSRIGVMTSLQAAALRDIVITLRRRAPYAGVIVYPVPVQGQGAGARIARMLRTVSARTEVEVVILARGGGSIEDLWAFNEEVVARAVRACAVPVIVGVGHESDFTIADFVADVRAPTPTAAAELVAPDRAALLQSVQHAWTRTQHMMAARQHVLAQRLDYAVRALAAPRAPIRGLQARLESLGARMAACGANALAARAARVSAAVRALKALDPRRVVARGYALVRNERGRLVTDAAELEAEQRLELELARGAARVRVESKRD
jgi:exodeoxyribonuclease VII large subunit